LKQNILEKGAIMQRDGETFAVKVHMPGGYTDAQELRRIADTAKRHGVPQIKVTNAQRIRPASWAFRKRNWTPSALTLGTWMKVA